MEYLGGFVWQFCRVRVIELLVRVFHLVGESV